MRLIDADAFLERIKKDPLFPLVEKYGLSGVIEAEPTVEARTTHGHWMNVTDDESVDYEYACSICGYSNFESVVNTFNFCPFCGTEMDEVYDSDDEQLDNEQYEALIEWLNKRKEE